MNRLPPKPVSACGTQRTLSSTLNMSAFGGKAEIEWQHEESPLLTHSGHGLLPRGSHSPDHRQSFRITLEFEVGALYGLTIEVHVKRLSRLDREGRELAIEKMLVPRIHRVS